MLTYLFRSPPGSRFVEFMRGDRGKKLDIFLVKHFNFSLLMLAFSKHGGFPYIPVLLLTTTGRKSGVSRTTVMPYLRHKGTIYVIGSNGAKPNDPAWVGNLKADPAAAIRVNWRTQNVKARILDHESLERAEVWKYAAQKTPQYNIYQSRTDRQIPVVALDGDASN